MEKFFNRRRITKLVLLILLQCLLDIDIGTIQFIIRNCGIASITICLASFVFHYDLRTTVLKASECYDATDPELTIDGLFKPFFLRRQVMALLGISLVGPLLSRDDGSCSRVVHSSVTAEQKRVSCLYGNDNIKGQQYAGIVAKKEECGWKSEIKAIRDRIASNPKLNFQANSCFLNGYTLKDDYIGWHKDKGFVEKGDETVVTVTLGGQRRFVYRPNDDPGITTQSFTIGIC